MFQYVVALFCLIGLSACAPDKNGPIPPHHLAGVYTPTGNYCTGAPGAESCQPGALPTACSGVPIFSEVDISVSGTLVSVDGGLYLDGTNMGMTIPWGVGVPLRFLPNETDLVVFTFAPNCELEFSRELK